MNIIEVELKDYLFFDSEKSLLIKPGEKLICHLRKKDVVIFHHSGWWSISHKLYKRISKPTINN